ncbi:3,2-trans-enoyl-CoA isomerase, putative [Bodo saltans]|uniref:Enoyl-CoA delta isomerase 1, mitochondrial n=1 Tax=Bodo saltans TaxID=75058 RepID=A0A0S4IKH3_BODSA|nr:3,2-trans-enoyl-CoA isomerase, putative [Bodo saltans]|eukprot:CUE60322.1 3,2-trans-enoyl-CoA isomerase, putative [Bodo saltans]
MRRVASVFARRALVAPLVLSQALRHQGGQQIHRGDIRAELRAPQGSRPAVPARGGQQQQQQEGGEAPEFTPVKPQNSKYVQAETDAATGIATLKMGRAPVNSLSLEFFTEFNQWLLWLRSDEAVKSVIITSAIPLVFSAGLDINELHQPQPERMAKFWTAFQEMWLILNSFPKPLIAAINGNSPAGGCIISLACDFRVMARSPKAAPEKLFRIGLNETKLGLVAPPWVMAGYSYVLGHRRAERMLQLGETPTADEALMIGLVDSVVEEDQVYATAVKEASRFMAVPNQARWMSRDMVRQEVTAFLRSEEERDYDTQFFMQMVNSEEVQKSIGGYLARLSKAAAKK